MNTVDIDKIKDFFIDVVLPLVSLVVGVIPLVWQISFDRNRNHFFKLLIAISLTILTGILLFSFLSMTGYLLVSVVIFLFWIIIIYRKNINTLLYKIGIFQIFKINVAVVIPSSAFFNLELIDGIKHSLNNSFKIYNKFQNVQRNDILESQQTDIDYVYYIDDVIRRKIRYMVLHIKSRMLSDAKILNALIRYAQSGGTIINLVSHLDIEPFVNAGAVPPYSVVLEHEAGVEILMHSILTEFGKDENILILKGPDTSETSTRRMEIVSKHFLGKKIKIEVESLDRWTADQAYERITCLVDEKKRNYSWIIAWNDEIALGVCHFFDNRPDLAKKPKVIGFDKIPASITKINDPTSVFYKTVDMQMYKVGTRAGELLDSIISRPDTKHTVYVPVSYSDIQSKNALPE